MKIKQSEAEAVLQEWIDIEKSRHVPKGNDEVTAREYALKTGIAYDTARGKLDKWVSEGLWTRRVVSINGRWAYAYKPKGKPRESK